MDEVLLAGISESQMYIVLVDERTVEPLIKNLIQGFPTFWLVISPEKKGPAGVFSSTIGPERQQG